MTSVTKKYNGRIPLGAVIGFVANMHVNYDYPSGIVKNGMVRCDGTPFASLETSKYHPVFTGSLPNLTDQRFLAGSTTIGSTGGIATIDITHTHTATTGFGLSGSWAGTAAAYTVTVPDHGHPQYNRTDMGVAGGMGGSHSHTFYNSSIRVAAESPGGGGVVSGDGTYFALYAYSYTDYVFHSHPNALATTSYYYERNGSFSASGTFTPNGKVDGSFTNPTLSLSGVSGLANYTLIDNRPQFVSCIFLMRVI